VQAGFRPSLPRVCPRRRRAAAVSLDRATTAFLSLDQRLRLFARRRGRARGEAAPHNRVSAAFGVPILRSMATTRDPRVDPAGIDAWRELFEAKPERAGELFSTMSGVENE